MYRPDRTIYVDTFCYSLDINRIEKRKARFKCVLVFKDNSYEEIFEGSLEGYIWFEKRGKNGFGYDPIFYLPEYNKTVGELESKEKNNISHRCQAISKLVEFLKINFSF